MKRPNILVLYTDQQRWNTLKANGNHWIKTPNLDRLAAEGVNFNCCIAQNPVCMPSRISLLTGQYCSALKITQMGVTVPQDTLTLQKILRNYGYYNGLIGKLHFLPHANRDHRELHPSYDFHHMELSDEPGCYEDAYRAWVRRKAPEQFDHISLGLPAAAKDWQKWLEFSDDISHAERAPKKVEYFRGSSDVTHTAFVGQQTIEFLRGHKEDTFFCFSGFYAPHPPWKVPKEYLDLYEESDMPLPDYPSEMNSKRNNEYFSDKEVRSVTRGYYASISEVDFWIGRILRELDQLGLTDNTIIVFTSDHGEWLGEHLQYGKGYWAPDVISRVPLIFKVPEKLGGAAGRQVADIVECVDVVPTLLELTGISVPGDIQGDRLPVTKDSGRCEGDGLGLTESHGWKSLRGNGYRYVVNSNGDEYLYDLAEDPWEYRDVAQDREYSELLNTARKSLMKRVLEIEKPLRREWPY